MSDTKKIVFSIIQFLNSQLQDGGLSQDSQESLEVAVQCLETSFGISANDTHLSVGKPLQQIFADGQQIKAESASSASAPPPPPKAPEATPEQKEEAETLKNAGNIAVREDRLQEAVTKYSQAIALDGNNAAYYSNRAAAYTKLGNYTEAVADAQRALQIDPTYTKAYSRLALAYAGLNRFEEARTEIKRALELDPGNESYQNNLRVIESRMEEMGLGQGGGGLPGAGLGGLGGLAGMGGMNFEALLNNPAMMNVAAQMMQDPNMQQMMNGIMGSMGGGGPAPGAGPGAGAAPGGGGGGFEALLQAGQRLAEQVRATNPELIEQLRQQMGGPGGPGGPPPPTSGGT